MSKTIDFNTELELWESLSEYQTHCLDEIYAEKDAIIAERDRKIAALEFEVIELKQSVSKILGILEVMSE